MNYSLKINKRFNGYISNALFTNIPKISCLSISAISNLLEIMEYDDFEIELLCCGRILERDYQLSLHEIVNTLSKYAQTYGVGQYE